MSGTVTEDYILGVEVKREGFKCAFAAVADEGLDFVATREFFPKTLAASIKQKARWVYGINFEAMCRLGWKGGPWDFYFFVRDRKGLFTNFLPAALPAFARPFCPWLSRPLRDAAEPRAGIRSVNVGQPDRADRPLHRPRHRLPQSIRHVRLVRGSGAVARCALHQHGRRFSSLEGVSRRI
jgi:hypothetical protein